MAILPIYLYGHDVLRAKAKPVQAMDDSLVKLVYDMFETMRNANGIGLAATQVGDLRRVIVIDITGAENDEEEGEKKTERKKSEGPTTLVLINPVVRSRDREWTMEEGCLSIPDVRGEVTRAETITVVFRDAKFQETELTTDGLLARVILHEIDHLDGILFIDHLTTANRALLKPKLTKIKKGVIETTYPVISAASKKGMRRVLRKVEA
ncbi:MAG TPA: peptide deformylase [Bacteroidota bacterium]|nr:peptide deformylase [Bacteroidota bacterium]